MSSLSTTVKLRLRIEHGVDIFIVSTAETSLTIIASTIPVLRALFFQAHINMPSENGFALTDKRNDGT